MNADELIETVNQLKLDAASQREKIVEIETDLADIKKILFDLKAMKTAFEDWREVV